MQSLSLLEKLNVLALLVVFYMVCVTVGNGGGCERQSMGIPPVAQSDLKSSLSSIKVPQTASLPLRSRRLSALGAGTSEASTTPPYLEEDAAKSVGPVPRFIPRSNNERLTSIYTWWNILDRLMEKTYLMHNEYGTVNVGPKWIYGYVRRHQMEVYTTQLGLVNPVGRKKRYCEIGVNGGHGTVAMLLTDPNLDVVSFDLGAYRYSKKVYDIIGWSFPGRITFHVGSSYDDGGTMGTVNKFAEAVASGREEPCDVILIDGDHRHYGAYQDILNARKIAACDNVLLFDDLNEASGGAFNQAVKEEVLTLHKRYSGGAQNRDVNPCLRWIGNPACYNTTDSALIKSKCVRCLAQFSFATASVKEPLSPGCASSSSSSSG